MTTAAKKKRSFGSMKKYRETRGTFKSKSVSLPEGMDFFSVDKAGPKYLDFLPYEVKVKSEFARPGDWFAQRTFFVHRGVGPNNETYCCPRRNWGKPCPICEERARLEQFEGTDEDVLQNLKPKERQLWLVKDLKDPDKGIQLWDVSFYLFGEMLNDFLDNADESDHYDEFWLPEGGKTIKVGFKEKRYASRTYYDSVSIEMRPRKTSYGDDVLDSLPCLDDLLIETSYADLKEAFQAFVPEQEEGEENPEDSFSEEIPEEIDDDPLAGVEAPWDSDEEEEEEDDDELEDEAPPAPEPAKKRGPGRPKKSESAQVPKKRGPGRPKKTEAVKPPEPEEEEEEEEEADDWDGDDWR